MNNKIKNVFKGIVGELVGNHSSHDPLGLHEPKKNHQVLKRFGIYKSDTNEEIFKSPAVSNLTEDYYRDFSMQAVMFPNSYPFAIVVSRDNINIVSNTPTNSGTVEIESENVFSLNGSKNVTHIIDYEDESAYDVVYNLLTDLDKKVLRIISEFRNVQYLQLLRELGEKSKRIDKSLDRLNRLYLIQKFRFKLPDEVEKEYGDCYSIYSHGSYLLMKHMDLSPQFAYKWKEQQRREDDFSPIRHWKIMDAYLNFRFHKEFAGFVSYSYLNQFTYTEKIGKRPAKHRPTSKAEEQFLESTEIRTPQQTKEITRLVRRVRFNGQILLYNKDTQKTTKFDLYPFITSDKHDSDLSRLETIFKHYGRFENGLDSEGNKRFLLIIVDNPSVIELIEEEYRLSDRYVSLENILFMDLSESKKDFFSSIKRIKHLDNNNPELRTVQFKIADNM
jgi:hypothetical protein